MSVLPQILYSDKRFKRLFRALDVNADNFIKLDDFRNLIFPELDSKQLENILDNISEAESHPAHNSGKSQQAQCLLQADSDAANNDAEEGGSSSQRPQEEIMPVEPVVITDRDKV
jgi:hypothetical protein